jgi:preprotein translocase SecE subunit
MGASQRKAAAGVAEQEERKRRVDRGKETPRSRGSAPSPAPPRPAAGGSPLRIFKPGQGGYVRWGTAIGCAVITIAGAHFVYEQMARFTTDLWWRVLVPVGMLVVLGYLVFRLVGQSKTAVDFMIATEGEMKKVNWSSRKEVFGATRVVIVMVLALACFLFVVNMAFILLFKSIKVLKIPIFESIFGGSESGV